MLNYLLRYWGTLTAGGPWSVPAARVCAIHIQYWQHQCTEVNATAIVTVTQQALPNAGTSGTLTVCAGTTQNNAHHCKKNSNRRRILVVAPVAGVYTYAVLQHHHGPVNVTATVTVTQQVLPNAGTNGTPLSRQSEQIQQCSIILPQSILGTPTAGMDQFQ
jgi:hypothetical protein